MRCPLEQECEEGNKGWGSKQFHNSWGCNLFQATHSEFPNCKMYQKMDRTIDYYCPVSPTGFNSIFRSIMHQVPASTAAQVLEMESRSSEYSGLSSEVQLLYVQQKSTIGYHSFLFYILCISLWKYNTD